MIVSVQSNYAIGAGRLNLSIVPGLGRGFSGCVANGDCLRGRNIRILTQTNANNTQVIPVRVDTDPRRHGPACPGHRFQHVPRQVARGGVGTSLSARVGVNANERWFPDKRLRKPSVVRPIGLLAARSIRSTPDSLVRAFIFVLYQPTLTWTLRRRRLGVPPEVCSNGFFSINQSRGWCTFAHHDEQEEPLPNGQCFPWLVLFAFICVHLRLNSLPIRRT
jgi:hypothetical protein